MANNFNNNLNNPPGHQYNDPHDHDPEETSRHNRFDVIQGNSFSNSDHRLAQQHQIQQQSQFDINQGNAAYFSPINSYSYRNKSIQSASSKSR
ncbi:6633_t:CDS:2, partial [Acaulospora morrowiae]